MKTVLKAALCALGTAVLINPAAAEPVYVDDSDYIESDRSVRIIRERDRSRIYGWTSVRPLDCGAYHYWDGAACVDARVSPPDIGPKR